MGLVNGSGLIPSSDGSRPNCNLYASLLKLRIAPRLFISVKTSFSCNTNLNRALKSCWQNPANTLPTGLVLSSLGKRPQTVLGSGRMKYDDIEGDDDDDDGDDDDDDDDDD